MTYNASIVGFTHKYCEERKRPRVNACERPEPSGHAPSGSTDIVTNLAYLHKHNTKVLLTIATYHLPFQNFISVTSSSASSSACTLSCLGVRVMRYGSGLRDDSPLYPSRDMGSSGSDRISNAQSNREMARHSSLSATWMAGQMRRLRRIRTKSQWGKTGDGWQNAGNTLYAPRAERPMVPVHCVGEVARFRTRQCVA
jgi:hypothetical protein